MMQNLTPTDIEARTLQWVKAVVIGLNLCPFANAALVSENLLMQTEPSDDVAVVLATLAVMFGTVHQASEPATALLILPNGFEQFEDYLDLVDIAQALLVDLDFEGHLQLASFHPHYQFSDTSREDAANYTNRSPYPMLHILKESAVEKAIDQHRDTSHIPVRNVALLRSMSAEQISALLEESGSST